MFWVVDARTLEAPGNLVVWSLLCCVSGVHRFASRDEDGDSVAFFEFDVEGSPWIGGQWVETEGAVVAS